MARAGSDRPCEPFERLIPILRTSAKIVGPRRRAPAKHLDGRLGELRGLVRKPKSFGHCSCPLIRARLDRSERAHASASRWAVRVRCEGFDQYRTDDMRFAFFGALQCR